MAISNALHLAPWKNRRYRFSRSAMVRFPTSGRPMKMRTCRSPMLPASAAMGGGTVVGVGFIDVAVSKSS